MVSIKPFRGIRYSQRIVPDLSKVAAPPYDVIAEEERQKLLQKSEFNFVRLSLGNQGSEKNIAGNNYGKAKQLIQQWLQQNVLLQEEKDSFYIYRQQFSINGKKAERFGLLCLLHLEPFSNGNILPHEKTLPKPKEDRLLLLSETRCDLEQIWLIAEKTVKLEKALRTAAKANPAIDFFDLEGSRHTVWKIDVSKKINWIVQLFDGKRLFIADGHHRYETALAFAQQNKSNAAEFKMVYIVAADSNALQILPTHRALVKVPEKEKFLQKLGQFFDVKQASRGKALAGIAESKSLCIAMFFNGKFFILRENGKAMDLLAEKPAVLRELPAFVLDSIVFRHIAGTGIENILFEKSAEKLIAKVQAGGAEAAFFIQAVSAEQFSATCTAGHLMPQKSTFFYPKPLSGLVFYKLE